MSGHQIGSILSLLISPFIIGSFSTASLFYIYGALGFAWLSLWDPMVPNHPPKAALSDTEEDAVPLLATSAAAAAATGAGDGGLARVLVVGGAGGSGGGAQAGGGSSGIVLVSKGLPGSVTAVLPATAFTTDLPWRLFMGNRCFWALLWAHSVFGIGYSMLIAWLPTYYNQVGIGFGAI